MTLLNKAAVEEYLTEYANHAFGTQLKEVPTSVYERLEQVVRRECRILAFTQLRLHDRRDKEK